jgi:hypothetical protein
MHFYRERKGVQGNKKKGIWLRNDPDPATDHQEPAKPGILKKGVFLKRSVICSFQSFQDLFSLIRWRHLHFLRVS